MVEHDGAGDQCRDRSDLVRHEQQRHPVAGERTQGSGQDLLVGQVDAGERLVHDQEVRLTRECSGYQCPPLLATGQGGDLLMGLLRKADRRDRVADDAAFGRAEPGQQRPRARQPTRAHDLLDGGGYAAADRVPLRHVPDPGPVVETRGRHTEEFERSRGERDEAEDGAEQSRLARPVGPEQGHDLATGDVEVEPGEGALARVARRWRPARRTTGASGLRRESLSSPARSAESRRLERMTAR